MRLGLRLDPFLNFNAYPGTLVVCSYGMYLAVRFSVTIPEHAKKKPSSVREIMVGVGVNRFSPMLKQDLCGENRQFCRFFGAFRTIISVAGGDLCGEMGRVCP